MHLQLRLTAADSAVSISARLIVDCSDQERMFRSFQQQLPCDQDVLSVTLHVLKRGMQKTHEWLCLEHTRSHVMWWFHKNTIRVAHTDRDLYVHILDPGKHALAKWVLPHSARGPQRAKCGEGSTHSRSRAVGLKIPCALHVCACDFSCIYGCRGNTMRIVCACVHADVMEKSNKTLLLK